MRQERTVQATIFEVFAQHEIGCELKAISRRQPRLGEFEFGDHLLHDLGDRSSSNQERRDDRDPGRQGEAVPRPA